MPLLAEEASSFDSSPSTRCPIRLSVGSTTTGEDGGRGDPLASSQRPDRLIFAQTEVGKELTLSGYAPMPLADQQLPDRHAVDLPAVAQNDLGCCQLTGPYLALKPSACGTHVVSPFQRLQSLDTIDRPGRVHHAFPEPPLNRAAIAS
jgi:hypothetical protein